MIIKIDDEPIEVKIDDTIITEIKTVNLKKKLESTYKKRDEC